VPFLIFFSTKKLASMELELHIRFPEGSGSIIKICKKYKATQTKNLISGYVLSSMEVSKHSCLEELDFAGRKMK
jgi:hypothetical protein